MILLKKEKQKEMRKVVGDVKENYLVTLLSSNVS